MRSLSLEEDTMEDLVFKYGECGTVPATLARFLPRPEACGGSQKFLGLRSRDGEVVHASLRVWSTLDIAKDLVQFCDMTAEDLTMGLHKYSSLSIQAVTVWLTFYYYETRERKEDWDHFVDVLMAQKELRLIEIEKEKEAKEIRRQEQERERKRNERQREFVVLDNVTR